MLGTALASALFAIALICAGQSSTLTGTLAGQIVMEGFLRFKIKPVLRRLITRMIAIIPAIIVLALKGEEGSYDLLIFSQVILSLQLPFAIVPLIRFTSDRTIMGNFANKRWVKILAWSAALIIIGLNANLIIRTVGSWIAQAGAGAVWIWFTLVPMAVGCAGLLLYVALPQSLRRTMRSAPEGAWHEMEIVPPHYATIGAAIDYQTPTDKVLAHAATLARQHGARLYLFHIVEGASGLVQGTEAYDEEARQDAEAIQTLAAILRDSGLEVVPVLGYGRVSAELVRLSRLYRLDLLIMGEHGHRRFADLLYGTSISRVRHDLAIPVLVVK